MACQAKLFKKGHKMTIKIGSIVANKHLQPGTQEYKVVLNLITKHSTCCGPIENGTAILSDFTECDVEHLYVVDDSVTIEPTISYPFDKKHERGTKISEFTYKFLLKKLQLPREVKNKVAFLVGWEEKELFLNYIYKHDDDHYMLTVSI